MTMTMTIIFLAILFNMPLQKKLAEYVVVQNYEDMNYEIIFANNYRLASTIDPLQNEIIEIEGVDNENQGK